MPLAAYYNPTALGPLEGANLYVWVMGRMLADQKFMTIFSMLFGASIVLITERAEARGDVRRVHYRRMGWLLIIGPPPCPPSLVRRHPVPLCGLRDARLSASPTADGIAARARSGAARDRLGLFGRCRADATVLAGRGTVQPHGRHVETYAGDDRDGACRPTAAVGSTSNLSGQRAPFEFETYVLISWGLWRAGGLMLIGMALFRSGVFSAERSPRFYAALLAAAVVFGLPLVAYGIAIDFGRGWPLWSLFLGAQFNYWPSIAVSLGYVGLVMLVCRTKPFARLDPSVCSRRTDRPHQLPATDRPLHDSLLRPRSCLVRDRGSRGAGLGGGRRRGQCNSSLRRFGCGSSASVLPNGRGARSRTVPAFRFAEHES